MSTKESITLREEIDYLEAYLGLQKMRLDSKMNYAHRILQKEEAINATLNATTPTVTVTNTITSTSSPASEANQLAILNVL
jgi:LytS/YehU family sensor histidine kinase